MALANHETPFGVDVVQGRSAWRIRCEPGCNSTTCENSPLCVIAGSGTEVTARTLLLRLITGGDHSGAKSVSIRQSQRTSGPRKGSRFDVGTKLSYHAPSHNTHSGSEPIPSIEACCFFPESAGELCGHKGGDLCKGFGGELAGFTVDASNVAPVRVNARCSTRTHTHTHTQTHTTHEHTHTHTHVCTPVHAHNHTHTHTHTASLSLSLSLSLSHIHTHTHTHTHTR